MYKKMLPLLGISFFNYGYLRQLTNMGTIPATATISYVACGDTVKTIEPLSSISFDSGGCCVTGITLSAEGFEPQFFGLDDNSLAKQVYDMSGTGAGMACKAIRFTFLADQKSKTFRTPATMMQAGGLSIVDGMVDSRPFRIIKPGRL